MNLLCARQRRYLPVLEHFFVYIVHVLYAYIKGQVLSNSLHPQHSFIIIFNFFFRLFISLKLQKPFGWILAAMEILCEPLSYWFYLICILSIFLPNILHGICTVAVQHWTVLYLLNIDCLSIWHILKNSWIIKCEKLKRPESTEMTSAESTVSFTHFLLLLARIVK